jgi:hypothetical protein
MVDSFNLRQGMQQTVGAQARRAQINFVFLILGLLGASAMLGFKLLRGGPDTTLLAWIPYLIGLVLICYQPRYGVYLLIFFCLIGDIQLAPWYPFTKNFSSAESLLYLNDALIISPLESYIGITGFMWLLRMVVERRLKIFTGPVFWPTALYIGFVTYGLFNGLIHHGDRVIALWEARPIYYILAMLLLTSNLIETREHLSQVLWLFVTSLFVRSLFGLWYVYTVLNFNLAGVESIAEHSMSILFNSIYVLAIAVWMYRDTRARRLVLLLVLPTILFSYVANNRRASFIVIGIALVLIAVMLFRIRRRLFMIIVPPLAVLGVVYLGIFWGASGPLAAPAKAVRSVIGTPDPRDASSNLYRDLENINIMFTIKTAPLTGIGFGQKFYRISGMVQLDFPFADYLTHNSILWVWMNVGLGGFMSMLMMLGMAVMVGARAMWRSTGGLISVAAMVSTLSIIMHFIFAYVDMSWSVGPMIYVGLMMGIINSLEPIAARPAPAQVKRWPWQADEPAPPGLRPIPERRPATFRWW